MGRPKKGPSWEPREASARLRERLAALDRERSVGASDWEAALRHITEHNQCPPRANSRIEPACAVARALVLLAEHTPNAEGPVTPLAQAAWNMSVQLRAGLTKFRAALADYVPVIERLHDERDRFLDDAVRGEWSGALIDHRHDVVCEAPVAVLASAELLLAELDLVANALPREVRASGPAVPMTDRSGKPADLLARDLIAVLDLAEVEVGGQLEKLDDDAIGALLFGADGGGRLLPKTARPGRRTPYGQRVHDLRKNRTNAAGR